MAKKKCLSLTRRLQCAASFFGVIFIALFLVVPVFSQSNNLNVGLTITSGTPPAPFCGDGSCNGSETCGSCSADCGGCPPPPDNPPIIGTVTVTSTLNSATINWSATDDRGLSGSSFVYGQTTGYGSVGSVNGFYVTTLNSLFSGTTYYFQITVTDTGGNNVSYTGSFSTLVADLTAPNISAISVVTSSNSATISWNTNEAADTQIQYGTTIGYGSSANDATFQNSHSIGLSLLSPVTLYHYRIIATDTAGNATTTLDHTFITAPDAVPPADVTNLVLAATTSTISLSWTNPTDPDFLNVRVVRKAGSAPTSPADGTLLYTGTNTTLVDTTPVANIIYYYEVYSYDTSSNHSGGAFVSGQLAAPPSEICNNNIDDNFNGLIDCNDSACTNNPVCAPPQNEICNNGIDDNHNNLTDCADPACVNTQICAPPASEICGNGIDDNQNNLTDCADPACSGTPACRPGGGGGGTNPEICNNNTDDDGNGKIDCADAACIGFPGCVFIPPTSTPGTTTPIVVPEITVSSSDRLSASDLRFLTGNRRIEVTPREGTVTGLAGVNFTIGIPADKLPSKPESAHITFDGENHAFGLNSEGTTYFADFVFPQIGNHRGLVQINYGGDERDVITVNLQSLPLGQVLSGRSPLQDSTVTLFNTPANSEFEASSFGLYNPQQSTVNGTFGWVVPNGKYYITAVKDGYYTRKTPVFEVNNNVVNSQINLIQLPPKLDIKKPQDIAKIVELTTQAGLQKLSDTIIEAKDLADNPQVEETVTTVVAPSVVGVVAVGTVAAVSWANIIPLLQLLFLQPLVFFGSRRKREAWGQVYNSLNKLPVDLAAVRLISDETGRVIQSKVTDNQGRYAFVVNPGAYRIEVIKNSYVFPSALLMEAKNDGKKIDIYHGEVISVTEKEVLITANIPLDPAGEHEKPTRIRYQRLIHEVQMFIWWVGLVIIGAAIYISPRWYMWVMLAVQLVFFALLRIMAVPPKIKSWGIVYDITNKQPVGRAVARLFNVQFNKLVASQVTDSKGRYYFLAGDNEYYITYEHPEYNTQKTSTIDLKGSTAEAINVDVGLKPQDEEGEAKPDMEDKAPAPFR